MLYSLTKKRQSLELSFPNITFTRKNNTMKHFYHYLLTVFLAGQVPGWGQNATEKKHIFVNDSITGSSGGVCKSGTAAGESVGRQVAVRHSEPGKR